MSIDEKLGEDIWHPKLMFTKSHYVQKVKGYGFKDAVQFYMTRKALVRSEFLRIKFPCRFNFQSYPFDKHECKLEFYDIREFNSKRIALERVNVLVHDFECPSIFIMT